jgi:hypothetical protein
MPRVIRAFDFIAVAISRPRIQRRPFISFDAAPQFSRGVLVLRRFSFRCLCGHGDGSSSWGIGPINAFVPF